MNIYIYGNQSFKKEIHETLDHSNIKFKLDDNCCVIEVNSVNVLKNTISSDPKAIYLIDDEKIIKKNSLNQKLKFLTPKDGIEEDFLLDSGIADLSIDSLKEIPKYILKKYEEQKSLESNIQDSIIDIVDEAYEKNSQVELDDELAMLLTKEEPQIKKEDVQEEDFEFKDDLFENLTQDVNLDKIEDLIGHIDENTNKNISKDEFDDIMNFNDNFGLNNISFDYDDDNIVNTNEIQDLDFMNSSLDEEEDEDSIEETFEDVDFLEEIFSKKEKSYNNNEKTFVKNEEYLRSEDMVEDEFSELDTLNEKDLLEALNYNSSNIENIKEENKTEYKNEVMKSASSINVVNSSNVDDLAQLISKLLSNKTLEITIKIKD